MILLDTCVVLWLTDTPEKLSERLREKLQDPDTLVYVSPISALEIGIKVAKKKLTLPMPVSRWFPNVCERYRLQEIPLTSRIAAAATELPPHHADPADRLLIATARLNGIALSTPDPVIARYNDLNIFW